ncbi:unnamed protein product [Pieris brassicae]|uniref:Uncharacterized protein n=1 Tax=Pieris brassicae TaxID=7116 RepID=A0A9P0XCB7_PIEBR|nr:unnamed protein product [Pieris brassicae]
MSQSPDEARARIQKYKEERRKQLIARTATLFSANVTERRPRKAVPKSPEISSQLHSSSELNLNTASTSVPIRTTRTSRLRAAAASNADSSPKKNNRSSSVQSLLDDDNSKAKDKKRPLTNRRQSHEKENIKNISTTSKDGAIRKKHSTNKNILEKDKSNLLVCTPKGRNVDVKYNSKIDTTTSKLVTDVVSIKEDEGNVDDVFNNILGENTPNSLDKENFEELYKDLVEDSNGDEDVLIDNRKLKYSNKSNIPIVKDDLDVIVKCNGDVPKVKEVGLLGAVCIRKVERFSELFHNLCAPCEADVLFEDLLVDNGIDTTNDWRAKEPECTPPCRRAQPSRLTSTPKTVQESPKANGDGEYI